MGLIADMNGKQYQRESTMQQDYDENWFADLKACAVCVWRGHYSEVGPHIGRFLSAGNNLALWRKDRESVFEIDSRYRLDGIKNYVWVRDDLGSEPHILGCSIAVASELTIRQYQTLTLINKLREESASSVTIVCPNHDGDDEEGQVVIINDAWTDWEDVRFSSLTLHGALHDAIRARDAATKPVTTKPQPIEWIDLSAAEEAARRVNESAYIIMETAGRRHRAPQDQPIKNPYEW